MTTTNTKVSVIVPTYNRSKALAVVLPSYVAESPREIIVVDDGSTDRTAAVVEEISHRSPMPIRYLRHSKHRGAPAARNTGVNYASGEYVLFGEDDVLLEPGYLAGLLNEMTRSGADIVGGRIVGMQSGEEKSVALSRADAYDGDLIDPINVEGHFGKFVDAAMEVPFLHSIALMRSHIASEVAFDEGYRGNGYREETDFYVRARSQGAKIVFVPNAVCYHVSGSINSSGGQRMNRMSYEFWAIVNNTRFTYKNYDTLRTLFGWQQGPLRKSMAYAVFRCRRLFTKIARKLRAP